MINEVKQTHELYWFMYPLVILAIVVSLIGFKILISVILGIGLEEEDNEPWDQWKGMNDEGIEKSDDR